MDRANYPYLTFFTSACGARKKAPGRAVYDISRKRSIHKIRQRAVDMAQCGGLRAVCQPRDFLKIGNFETFSEFLHNKGRHFPEFVSVQVSWKSVRQFSLTA